MVMDVRVVFHPLRIFMRLFSSREFEIESAMNIFDWCPGMYEIKFCSWSVDLPDFQVLRHGRHHFRANPCQIHHYLDLLDLAVNCWGGYSPNSLLVYFVPRVGSCRIRLHEYEVLTGQLVDSLFIFSTLLFVSLRLRWIGIILFLPRRLSFPPSPCCEPFYFGILNFTFRG